MQQNSLRRLDSDGSEHFHVGHWKHDGFDELLDLLVAASNVGVVLTRLFVNLHSLDAGIKLAGQLLQDEIAVLVNSNQVRRLQLVAVD